MENRVVDMRELYQEWKDFDEDNSVSERGKKRSTSQKSKIVLLIGHTVPRSALR